MELSQAVGAQQLMDAMMAICYIEIKLNLAASSLMDQHLSLATDLDEQSILFGFILLKIIGEFPEYARVVSGQPVSDSRVDLGVDSSFCKSQ